MKSEVRFLAQHLLHAGLGPLDERDCRVIARIAKRVHAACNVNRVFDDHLTVGERLADWGSVIGGAGAAQAAFERRARTASRAANRASGSMGLVT